MNIPKHSIHFDTPARTAPLAPWPFYEQAEISAATVPLSTGKVNYWTGTEGRDFEKEFAAYTGCNHAIALTNGTVAWNWHLCPGKDPVMSNRYSRLLLHRQAQPLCVERFRLWPTWIRKARTLPQILSRVTYSENKSDHLCSSCRMAL